MCLNTPVNRTSPLGVESHRWDQVSHDGYSLVLELHNSNLAYGCDGALGVTLLHHLFMMDIHQVLF